LVKEANNIIKPQKQFHQVIKDILEMTLPLSTTKHIYKPLSG